MFCYFIAISLLFSCRLGKFLPLDTAVDPQPRVEVQLVSRRYLPSVGITHLTFQMSGKKS